MGDFDDQIQIGCPGGSCHRQTSPLNVPRFDAHSFNNRNRCFVSHHNGHGPVGAPGPMSADEELILDVTGIILDVAGIFDPTPISDGASATLELARGNYGSAALSAISIVPYIGDFAKLGKLPRYVRTVTRVLERARASERFAEMVTPVLRRLLQTLNMMPAGVNASIDSMREAIAAFVRRRSGRAVAAAVEALPDISHTFRFGTITRGRNTVQWAEGRLGVPGRVRVHDSAANHRAITHHASGSHPGDQAGHLIGRQYGAPDVPENLTPQNYVTNSRANRADDWIPQGQSRYGTYRRLEDRWTELLGSGTGVHVRVEDVFRAGETRPFMRRVEWTEIAADGSEVRRSLDFMNPHTPNSRAAQGVH
jgi:hypothetical protein